MKKIISFFTFQLLLVITSITLSAKALPDTVVINYFRFFGHSETHTAWIWKYQPAGGDGVEDHVFTKDPTPESRWLTVEVDLKNDDRYKGATWLGIIIKEGSGWNGARQPGGDRFIDLSKAEIINNKANVYFVQESATVYYSIDDVDTSDRILDASFEKNHSISLFTTLVPQKTSLYADGIKVEDFTGATNYKYSITPSSFDISKNYEVEVDFGAGKISNRYKVSLRNLYDTNEYESAFHYDGDLGVKYTKEKSTFRIWTPISEEVNLLLYEQGHPNYDNDGKKKDELIPYKRVHLNKIEKGAWEVEVIGDLAGKYYTFELSYNNQTFEIVDPYAFSTGANGLRAMVVDFSKTNPKAWQYNSRPNTIKNFTDYIIYELHVRDLTTHSTWGGNPEYAGTFKGVAQGGTSYTNSEGLTVTTGLDHLTELGINAVHFLPIFDFGYVDETQMKNKDYVATNAFNWGYMPYNFNTPEGSYSTNPFNGYTRVSELKEMVQTLHSRNIRVIMDVVYNHTGETEGSQFEKAMPSYYFRQNNDGSFSNGSGTGNETASERSMFRKYMVDSILFWAKEYNISGFRFDLMELHDVETMNLIREEVNKVDPTIILYGEPWKGGETPLASSQRANKENMSKLTEVASFNDNSRNAVKWDWNGKKTGIDVLNTLRYMIAGATPVDYAYAQDNRQTFHQQPSKVINYVSAHDDEALRDFNFINNSKNDVMLQTLQKQSNAFVLTSQGIPFLHAGVDFMRSKPVSDSVNYDSGDHRVVLGLAGNSYNLPDAVNQLNWDKKATYYEVYNYYRHLIAIRRIMDQFRLPTTKDVASRLVFEDPKNPNSITYRILGEGKTPEVVVVHNNSRFSKFTTDKNYIMLNNKAGQLNAHGMSKVSAGTTIDILNFTTLILVEDNGTFNYNPSAEPYLFGPLGDIKPRGLTPGVLAIIIVSGVVLIAGASVLTIVLVKRKKTSNNK